MPAFKMIDAVKIDLYARDHPPPHFHAIYAEYEELIEIDTLKTIVGMIPKNQRQKVINRAKNHQDYLKLIFNQLNPSR